jgi:hypothetical protein
LTMLWRNAADLFLVEESNVRSTEDSVSRLWYALCGYPFAFV